jgi:hypothetical protein
MRGLMAKPDNHRPRNTITTANFREGLMYLQYFISRPTARVKATG